MRGGFDNKQVFESESFLQEGRGRGYPVRPTTPWVEALSSVYELEGLDRWDNRKVYAVCRMMGCTLRELCAWAGMFKAATIGKFEKANLWPMYLTIQWHRLVQFKTDQGGHGIMAQDVMAAQKFWTKENDKAA